jgi:hypothetical protein
MLYIVSEKLIKKLRNEKIVKVLNNSMLFNSQVRNIGLYPKNISIEMEGLKFDVIHYGWILFLMSSNFMKLFPHFGDLWGWK